jgi:hypothetical protein
VTRVYAVRVLGLDPLEVLAVQHEGDRARALQLGRHAVEDNMAAQVFDVTTEPARLVASFGPCRGHEPQPGSGAPMGIEVFCDGSCWTLQAVAEVQS